ncbi:hypothetical protein Bca52824_081441 [Brassica carinata]|uniref:Acyl-coenzyme A thioesterase 13 n=2 Tax=Brassica TaxID=3705 RepID=A0A8X7PHD7_BRACI|nr:hypothetical protein Bca52824_081441 [Brassica carinata]VDD61089.1 unnamed protein product [Brassica oleracea]
MEDSAILRVTTYLEELSNVRFDHFPGLILQGLQVIHVGKGFVQCKLIITDRVLGEDGTFHTGVIAALMELIGATAIYSDGGSHSHASIVLNYSLYSTAKNKEEVKIEARVVGRKEDLNSAVIEIRREYDEELIAMGRLRMVQLSLSDKHNGVHQASKL